jgi:hypothetical protein
VSNSIPQLRRLLKGELSQDRLEELSKSFDSLYQDGGSRILPFFVLHEVCSRLAVVMERNAPMAPDDIAELTKGIGEQIDDILGNIERGAQVSFEKLESLVSTLLKNRALHDG